MDKYSLIYDNNCNLCRKAVKRIKIIDVNNQIDCIAVSEALVSDKFAVYPKSEFLKEIHLFCPDGKVLRGAEAIAQIYLLSDSKKKYGIFLNLPIMRSMAKVIYLIVSRLRK